MDPKTTNLDPKLKEAYERIMGTAVPAPAQKSGNPAAKSAQNTPSPQTPKLQVQEVKSRPLNMSTVKPPPPPPTPEARAEKTLPDLPILSKPEPSSNEMVQSPEFPNLNVTKNSFSQPLPPPADIVGQGANINSPKKKSKLKPILLTFLGLIFFVVYGVVWAKVFKLF